MSSLGTWLQQIGLAQYTAQLEAAAIDLDVLPHLTEEHLKQLGLPLGHMIKLLRAAKTLNDSAAPEPARTPAPSPSPQAERRQLTVMFCDLVGSTALSQSMDPESLRDLMRRYQETCRAVVNRYEGHVAQYLGDGMMVYYGWPKAHEDDAERALRSALEVVKAVKSVTAPAALQVRIGVATGTVVVGDLADSDVGAARLAVGETPNLAARLQAMAGADEIIAGASTQRLVGSRFDTMDLGAHTLKGIVEPVQAYRVIDVSRAGDRFEARQARHLAPLIGRESEIALLQDRWDRAMNAEGQGIMLSAEAGIGKSRVVRALRESIGAQPHASFNYQCSPYHHSSAFFPVVEQLERAAQFGQGDDAQTRLDKLRSLLRDTAQDTAALVPLFAALLSLPLGGYPDLALSPQQRKERTIEALVQQIVSLSQRTPVIVVLEDAHWADPSSLEFLGALLERIEAMRIMLLLTFRPEFSPTWRGQARVTNLNIMRLSRREAAVLAERIAGKSLPLEVLEQLLAKSDGVPLFIEELTKAVVESGFMRDEGDRYSITGPLPPLAVPATLHDSLMARLDRMASVKELIQIGAVLGREFSQDLIAQVSGLPLPKLEEALGQLVSAELLFRRGTGRDAIYAFKHALVQDAAYESILRTRRAQLHASVAQVLEQAVDVAHSNPGLLAIHYEHAGMTDKAIESYMSAGHQANLRSANREALNYFERALALLTPSSQNDESVERRAEVLTEIGTIHMLLDGWASRRSLDHYLAASKQSAARPRQDLRFRTLVGLCTTMTWQGQASETKPYLTELTQLAESSGDRMQRMFSLQMAGQTDMYLGRIESGVDYCDRAIELYDEVLDRSLAFKFGFDPGMTAQWFKAYMLAFSGKLESAMRAADEGFRIGRAIGHAFSDASSYAYKIDLSYLVRLEDQMLECAREMEEVLERHAFAQVRLMCLIQSVWINAVRGGLPDGLEKATRALTDYYKTGAGAIIAPRLTAQVAGLYGRAGRAEEGLRLLNCSPDRQPGARKVRFSDICTDEGELHLAKSIPDEVMAEKLFLEGVQIGSEDGNRLGQLRAATALASLWTSQGKREAAVALLQPLYERFTEGFEFPVLKKAEAVLDNFDP